MKPTASLFLVATTAAFFGAVSVSAGEPPPPPMKDANGVLAVTVPARIIPEPEERGKPYKVPATEWKNDPILWGWTCELPDGTGMTFGGVHQTADDGLAHTKLKTAQGWTPIHEELRKANPLQTWFTRTRAIRDACKDALAKARHLYLEGKTADDETKLVAAEIDPAIGSVAKDLAALLTGLKALKGQATYEAGQVSFSLKHLDVAASLIKPFAGVTTPERMVELRKGQIALELAAEAFDAEPPPRALAKIAYEPKSKSYVIFGGEHFDYCTNDLWVFDSAKRRWFQRHQEAAPEPRLDAHFEPTADGRVLMRGGAMRDGVGFVHVGPAKWLYDLERNTWIADGHSEKTFPSDTRIGQLPPSGPPHFMPEHFLKAPRPDAAANEAKLKAIAPNTWTRLKTPIGLGSRAWATWAYAPERDMLFLYAGGHACYGGCDVARYHLATDRWEISDPLEGCLGCWGTNEQYPCGYNFNRRPWAKPHVWNGHAYDPILKKTIMGSVTIEKIDPYCYLYDPDKADWVERIRLPKGMPNFAYNFQIRHSKHGMFSWNGGWLFDAEAKTWNQLQIQGKLPGGGVDSSGLVYDPKRDRMLMLTLGGYARPFDGQVHALDMTSLKVEQLNPEGMNPGGGRWDIFLREMAYHPASDLFLWPQRIKLGGKEADDRYVAYDAAKNRWVVVKLAVNTGDGKEAPGGVCSGIHWDAKRGLFWLGNSGYGGGIWVLRFDPATAEITPLKDYAPAAPPAPATGK